MLLMKLGARQFSQKNNDNQEDYSKKFESLLGKTATPITDSEKEDIEKLKLEKAKLDAKQAELDD